MSYRFFNIIALLSLCAVNISAHTGKVFVDANANGRFDKGEKLLKGVVVSDGLNVVKTASDGTYVLPGHERERFIFITTPSGYKTMNRYYHRIGEGTDFGLIPYNPGIGKNGEHHFIQITDTEIFNTSNQEDWISNIRDYASNQKSAFVIHTGDICYEKGLREHIKLMNTENMNVPVYYCIGNHDLVKGKYGEELFESIYGPVYYSFDVAGVHYVVTPMSGGDHKPGYTSDDVCNWLKNDLSQVADGTPVVVFNHDLLTTSNDFVFKGESGSQLNLNDYNLRAWIYGHWHINYRRQQGDVTTICTSTLDKGGIDHSKSAYRVVGIDNDGKVSTELRYTYQDRHMVIASPQGVSATSFLTVNAYSSVSPVKQMTYVCLIGNKTVVSTQPLRQLTDWTWGADMLLDERLIGKELTVRVTATFNNGQKVEADSRFVYDPSSEIKIGKNWTNLVGNASHSALADTIGDDMHLAWVKNIGANIYMSSPLVYDGKVYVASVDEDHKGDAAIFALDGNTGNILWKYPVKNSIKNTIAITDGNVFAQDAEGNLYAVDAVSGQLKWQKRLDVKGIPAIVEGLAAENGIVYAGAGMGMAAFDAHTGKRLWQNDSWQQGEGTTSTISVGDGILAMGAQWSALYGNDASTGELKWSHSEYGLRNRGASPAIHNGLLYLVSDKSFFIINGRDGRIVVRKDLPYSVDVTSTPLLSSEMIVFGTAQHGLVALDAQTLEERWQSPVGDALVFTSPYTRSYSATIETSPVLSGDVIYVGASDGCLYGIDLKNGKTVWKHKMGAPIFSSVAISGNTLIASDFGGNIYSFCSK